MTGPPRTAAQPDVSPALKRCRATRRCHDPGCCVAAVTRRRAAPIALGDPISGACCRGALRKIAAARGGGERQIERHGGARAALGFHLDAAAMQLDEALDQRQAKPGAGLPRLRVAALELLEDAGLLLARDAGAVIGDDERDIVTLAMRLEADRAARRGEFDGVGDQVEQRLLEAPLVG